MGLAVGLEAVPPEPLLRWFHIGNVKPRTTMDNIFDFVSNFLKIPALKYSKLMNRNSYSSFKVATAEADVAVFTDPLR